MNFVTRSFLVAGLLAGATACNKSDATPPAAQQAQAVAAAKPAESGPTITAASRDEAKAIFGSRCMPCHGAGGAGDGPASAGLTPKPRNFTDAVWQGQVSNEHIEKIIQYGGAAVGKSPAMPPNPDLTSKPETVAALREHIRSLKK